MFRKLHMNTKKTVMGCQLLCEWINNLIGSEGGIVSSNERTLCGWLCLWHANWYWPMYIVISFSIEVGQWISKCNLYRILSVDPESLFIISHWRMIYWLFGFSMMLFFIWRWTSWKYLAAAKQLQQERSSHKICRNQICTWIDRVRFRFLLREQAGLLNSWGQRVSVCLCSFVGFYLCAKE